MGRNNAARWIHPTGWEPYRLHRPGRGRPFWGWVPAADQGRVLRTEPGRDAAERHQVDVQVVRERRIGRPQRCRLRDLLRPQEVQVLLQGRAGGPGSDVRLNERLTVTERSERTFAITNSGPTTKSGCGFEARKIWAEAAAGRAPMRAATPTSAQWSGFMPDLTEVVPYSSAVRA